MKAISGIQAAWLEMEGKGTLSVSGRVVSFKSEDGRCVTWHCSTPTEAKSQVKLFRAATKYPATKPAA